MDDTLYTNISKNIYSISIPDKWQANIECMQSTGNLVVVFRKLSSFETNFLRYIEKQLIITKDTYSNIICFYMNNSISNTFIFILK